MTVNHNEREHALIGFSGMHRTRNCWGWIQFFQKRLEQYKKKFGRDYKEAPKPAAEAGTILHELSEEVILNGGDYSNVPEESKDAVACYVDLIDDIYSKHNPETVQYLVEEKLDLTHLGGDCWGTPDTAIWSPGERLDVIDAKFGRGLVEPDGNEQLLSQGLGCVERDDIGWDFEEIYLWISQPLAEHDKGPNRAWKIDISKLKLWRVELFDLIQEVMKPNAMLCAGEWCKWCPCLYDMDGIPSCPEVELQAQALARTEFSDFNPIAPEDASNSQLALILECADALEYWLGQCKLEGYRRQIHGEGIPDAKLVHVKGKSSIDKRAYDKFAAEFEDVEPFYRNNPLTVGDFRKLMKEWELDHSEWAHVLKQGEGSIKLVTGVDTRSEYIPAELEFKDV